MRSVRGICESCPSVETCSDQLRLPLVRFQQPSLDASSLSHVRCRESATCAPADSTGLSAAARYPFAVLQLLNKLRDLVLGEQPAAPRRPSRQRPSRVPRRPASRERQVVDLVRQSKWAPPDLEFARKLQPVTLTTAMRIWGDAHRAVRFTRVEDQNAFLFGVLFDRQVVARAAWQAPFELAARLGHLDVRRLAAMSEADLAKAIGKSEGQKGIHRLVTSMARSVRGISRILLDEYDGRAENIWPDGTDIRELKRRLHALPGLGDKLVAMTISILVRDFGKSFTGYEEAEIAVDRHVARVFVRLGLVDIPKGGRVVPVSTVKLAVEAKAREMYPAHPAALDEAFFWVGKTWCAEEAARCGECLFRPACPGDRKLVRIGPAPVR